MFSKFSSYLNPFSPYSQRSNDQQQQQAQPDIQPITPTDRFKIVVVLDESGSMQNIRMNMLNSLNDLITEQTQIKERPAALTIIKFNDKINTLIENVPLETAAILAPEAYIPNGSTALYDALGYTINRFRNERDVLLVIITDGHENASTNFNKSYVSTKLKEKEKYNKWSYVYLSCDLSTMEQGNNMGFNSSAVCSNIRVDKESFGSYMSANVNSAVSNFRTKGISVQSQLN